MRIFKNIYEKWISSETGKACLFIVYLILVDLFYLFFVFNFYFIHLFLYISYIYILYLSFYMFVFIMYLCILLCLFSLLITFFIIISLFCFHPGTLWLCAYLIFRLLDVCILNLMNQKLQPPSQERNTSWKFALFSKLTSSTCCTSASGMLISLKWSLLLFQGSLTLFL